MQETGSEVVAGEPSITAKLEEIMSIREGVLQNYGTLLRAGSAPANPAAAIELAEARIELARERGQWQQVIAEMKGIVATRGQHLKRFQSVTTDHVSTEEIERARAFLLEAEVDLLREEGAGRR